jgi:hypothetical protein
MAGFGTLRSFPVRSLNVGFVQKPTLARGSIYIFERHVRPTINNGF